MRDPILHIKLSSLEKIMRQLDMKPEMAIRIMEVATKDKHQLRDKYFVTAKTAASKRKVEKTIEAESDVVELFNRILTAMLQIQRVKYIPVVRKDSKNYLLLKEIALLADNYTKEFQFEIREEGYKQFIKIAMEIMGKKYKLEKIKYYAQQIYDATECLQLVEKDNNREGTIAFHQTWKDVALRYTSSQIDLIKTEDYVHIIYARMEADEMKASYDHWITAQFDQLSFLNAIPELSQLYGLNAKKRYQSYMAKKGIKQDSNNAFLKADAEYKTDQEKEYWDRIRARKEQKASKV